MSLHSTEDEPEAYPTTAVPRQTSLCESFCVGAHFGGGGVTIYPIGSQLKDHSFLKNNFEIAFNLVLNRSAPFCVVFQ